MILKCMGFTFTSSLWENMGIWFPPVQLAFQQGFHNVTSPRQDRSLCGSSFPLPCEEKGEEKISYISSVWFLSHFHCQEQCSYSPTGARNIHAQRHAQTFVQLLLNRSALFHNQGSWLKYLVTPKLGSPQQQNFLCNPRSAVNHK